MAVVFDPTVVINGRMIGSGQKCFIIAEAGVNHNGDMKLAKTLIDVAVDAAVDAIKFQTFHAEYVAVLDAPKADYQLRTTDQHESQLEMLRRLELAPSQHRELFNYCKDQGLLFLSTPFDQGSVDLLDEIGVPAFKISSGEITNLPLLEHTARKGKPIILSTGMSSLDEVRDAVGLIGQAGNHQLILLHCVSNYPADPADANLKAMQTMSEEFALPVGYSDHTAGIEVAIAAVALGACLIEKHFTRNRDLPGPDHRASLEPGELCALVKSIRNVEVAIGHGRKQPVPAEIGTARAARRSLVAAADIPSGTQLRSELIAIRRPGTGLEPSALPKVIGRTARVDIPAGALIRLDMLS